MAIKLQKSLMILHQSHFIKPNLVQNYRQFLARPFITMVATD